MSVWTRKKERGSESLIRLIAWLAKMIGRPVCRVLLHPIAFYFVLTDATARKASIEFLSTLQKRKAGWWDVHRHLYHFAATLLDRVYMAAGEFHRFELRIIGREIAEEALAQGRGLLLLGSHLGSFDLMLLAQREMSAHRVSVMMRVDPRARVRRIAGIDDEAFDVIQTGRADSYVRAHEALEEGRVVAILADRVEGGAHRTASFLGRPAALPLAPHVLAARTGAPVMMFFGIYEGGNRYRIEFVEFGLSLPASSRGASLQPALDRYATLLGQYAQAWPLNWFNFYPYWLPVEDRE